MISIESNRKIQTFDENMVRKKYVKSLDFESLGYDPGFGTN
jgi:hypothetical protein